jgi:phosphohistidine phosphatase SixA
MYLARHATADWEIHPFDPPLSIAGRSQADAMAATCRRLGLVAIRTSPLRRARETALRIADDCGVETLEDDRLKEYGEDEPRETWERREAEVWTSEPQPAGELWVAHGGVLNAIWGAWGLSVPVRGPVDRHGSLVGCGEVWAVSGVRAKRVAG